MIKGVDITVDSREARIEVRKHVNVVDYLRVKGLNVCIKSLPCGDYYLHAVENRGVLIERKTIVDLANAIRTGRLWNQLTPLYLSATEDNLEVIIVVEGWIKLLEKFTKWRPPSIMRIIEVIETKYKLPVIYSANLIWTLEFIVAKCRSLGETKKKKIYPLRHSKKPMSLQERILYVAEGLGGVETARRLLLHFSTLRNIANANLGQLLSVKGIGMKRARLIYDIFNTPFEDIESRR